MVTIAVDASLGKEIEDEYYAWKRLQGATIVQLPPRGGPDARNIITLSGLEIRFLELLKERGISFTRV